jgi:hypothetical protein
VPPSNVSTACCCICSMHCCARRREPGARRHRLGASALSGAAKPRSPLGNSASPCRRSILRAQASTCGLVCTRQMQALGRGRTRAAPAARPHTRGACARDRLRRAGCSRARSG